MFHLKVGFSGVSTVLNMYFLGCILLLPSLRKPEFILIGWLSLCDVISFSIFGNVEKFMNLMAPQPMESQIVAYNSDGFGMVMEVNAS